MKTVGMIGGLGWQSTALYYKLINELVLHQLGGLNSAPLLISSLNLQEFVDYKNQNRWDHIAILLSETAHRLEQAGADAVALCCNTLHKVTPSIEDRLSVPFIHIAGAAGDALLQHQITTIGLLGTSFTMEDLFYSDYLKQKYAIKTITPPSSMGHVIDNIIYNELEVGICTDESKKIFLEIITLLEQQGVQAILLACTELNLLIQSQDHHLPIFDTTHLHAQKITEWILS